MKKYQLLELIAGLFQSKSEIRSTSISYRRENGDKSASMIVITKDEDVFEVKVRRI